MCGTGRDFGRKRAADRRPVPNCPGRRPGHFGTGLWSVRSTLTANIGRKRARRLFLCFSGVGVVLWPLSAMGRQPSTTRGRQGPRRDTLLTPALSVAGEWARAARRIRRSSDSFYSSPPVFGCFRAHSGGRANGRMGEPIPLDSRLVWVGQGPLSLSRFPLFGLVFY